MMAEKHYLYGAERVRGLADAICSLEGHAFGPSPIFYEDMSKLICREMSFRDVPDADIRQFADDLNAATKPVREAFAQKLRGKLMAECENLSDAADKPVNIDR